MGFSHFALRGVFKMVNKLIIDSSRADNGFFHLRLIISHIIQRAARRERVEPHQSVYVCMLICIDSVLLLRNLSFWPPCVPRVTSSCMSRLKILLITSPSKSSDDVKREEERREPWPYYKLLCSALRAYIHFSQQQQTQLAHTPPALRQHTARALKRAYY